MDGTGHRQGPPRRRSDTRKSQIRCGHRERQEDLDGRPSMTSNGEKERDGASDTVVEAGSLTDLSRGVMKHRRKGGEDEVLRQRKRRG